MCYVYTSSGRIFYTSIRLNDRFTQYQDFSPIGYGQDYRGYQVFSPKGYRQDCPEYFINRAPKRRNNEIYQPWNRFEKAPVLWDSNFYEHSGIWTFCSESPWASSYQQGLEIYKSVANIKRKKKKGKKKPKKNPKKKPKNAAREALTKEQLDEELDYYMMNIN